MAGLSELAASMLVSAQQRLDVTAANVSNINTPGYRSRKAFQRALDARQFMPSIEVGRPENLKDPALKKTGNPLDMAVTGSGSLLVRSGEALVPTVSGQFSRDSDGRLLDPSGRALQAHGGGDLRLSGDAPVLLPDGTLLIDGQAEARVGTFAVSSQDIGETGLETETIPDPADGAVLHQGMIVPSNVDLADEMVEITRASQMAQTGARIIQIYDDLMGRVASRFAEGAR